MTTSATPRITATQARVLALAGALVVYAVGAAIPLPGVDPSHVMRLLAPFWLGRASVFALGVSPLVTAILFIEVGRLIAPPFARWSVEPRNGFRLHVAAWTLALALAALQAIELVALFAKLRGGASVVDADPMSEFAAVVAMLGGMALLGWIGLRVTRAQAGDGLLVLYATPPLILTVLRVLGAVPLLHFVSEPSPAAAVAIDGAAVALLVLAALASKSQAKAALGFGGGRLDPIPAMVASAVAAMPALLVSRFVWPNLAEEAVTFQAITSISAAALIALTAVMRSALSDAPSAVPWPATAATMIVCAGMPFAAGLGPRGLLVNGYVLVYVVAAALSVLDAFGLLRSSRRAGFNGAD